MHRSFQKNKFHDHTIRILENRRVGTGGEKTYGLSPPRSSATILDQEEKINGISYDHEIFCAFLEPKWYD